MSRATAGTSLLLAAIVAAYGFRSIDGTEPTRPTTLPASGRPPLLSCYPSVVNFNEVPRGQSAQRVVYVANPWDQPVLLLGASTGSPSIQVVGFQNVIPPRSAVRLRLAFTPGAASTYAGQLVLHTQPTTARPAPVPLHGRASNLQSAPLPSATSLTLARLSARHSATGVVNRFLVEVAPLAPSAAGPLMQLHLPSSLPAGVQASLSTDVVRLGPLNLAELSVVTPYGVDPDFVFETCGEVLDGGPLVFCDEGESQPAPEGTGSGDATLPCGCDQPPPALHLKDMKTLGFADPEVGEDGPPPSLVPVAGVSAVLWGPDPGECCPGGKFELDLSVDSEFVNAFGERENNKLTAWFLASGLCNKHGFSLRAETNGKPHAISAASFAPVNCDAVTTDIGAMTRVALHTTAVVEVSCEQAGSCTCSVDGAKHVTRLALSGESEGGSIEVHWTVAVAGQDCRLTKSTGKIVKLIFTRNSQVYDPVNDKYVNMTGDPDGDGKSSYEEILKGGDPENSDQ